jgi:hypothetical protein
MAARNFFITWVDAANPAMGLDFFPPKGSDELFEALKEYYPHHKNLQARMQAAVIDFYLEQSTVDSDLMLPQSPDYLASPNSTSFASSMSTPMTQPLQMQPASPGVASSSAPKQEDLMTVWTLPSNPEAKIHKRRTMTDAEKVAYKAKRVEGACAECKRRRRKCVHSSSAASSDSSQTSERRKVKQTKRASTQTENAARAAAESASMPLQFEEPLFLNTQVDMTQFNLEFDFLNPLDSTITEDLPWNEDFSNTFDFSKDFQLYGDNTNYNTFVPQQASSHQSNAFDIEQYIDLNGAGLHAPLHDLQTQLDSPRRIASDKLQKETQPHRCRAEQFPVIKDLDRHVQQESQPAVFDSPGIIDSQKHSQRISDQVLGVGSSFMDVLSQPRGYTVHRSQLETQSTGEYDSTIDLFAAPAVEPTVSRSSTRSILSRTTKQSPTEKQRTKERWGSETATDSSVDFVQQWPQINDDRHSSKKSNAKAQAFLTIQTLLPPTPPIDGDPVVLSRASQTSQSNVNRESVSRNSATASTLSSSAISYTTLTFSVPTASLTSKLCSVVPSLSSASSASSTPPSSMSNIGSMSPVSPISVSLDVSQQLSSMVSAILALFLLVTLWMFPSSDRSGSPVSPMRRMTSQALQLLTLSSLTSSAALFRKNLTSSATGLSLFTLLSPLQSVSETS